MHKITRVDEYGAILQAEDDYSLELHIPGTNYNWRSTSHLTNMCIKKRKTITMLWKQKDLWLSSGGIVKIREPIRLIEEKTSINKL